MHKLKLPPSILIDIVVPGSVCNEPNNEHANKILFTPINTSFESS